MNAPTAVPPEVPITAASAGSPATMRSMHGLNRVIGPVRSLWRAAVWLLVGDRNDADAKQREANAFQPAALEVQDTPPLAAARRIVWAIVMFFVIAVLWACLGHVDIVVSAPGKVVPSGRVKLVQPLEYGIVSRIHVRDGQVVEAGAPLVDLDATTTGADETRVHEELAAARRDVERFAALHAAIESGRDQMEASPSTVLTIEDSLLAQQWNEASARKETLLRDMEKLQAQRAATDQTIRKLEQLLPIVDDRVSAVRTLFDKGHASKQSLQDRLEQQVETTRELEIQRYRLQETDAQMASLRSQQRSLAAELLTTALDKKLEAERRAGFLEQELVKAGKRAQQQVLRAPIAGVVKQLAVHTVGGVVTPAQELMQIVPADDVLEIEALIENKDIGFIERGQAAEVKLDAFPFTHYGLIPGQLVGIAADAVLQEDGRLIFTARVSVKRPDRTQRAISLVPGMTAMVEVKTGKRRIVDFFLSPVLEYKQSSLRER